MSRIVALLDRTLYPHQFDNWDDELFRERILRHVTPAAIVLDLGAGAGIVKQMNFKNVAAKICGIDVDPRVERNALLDEGKIADTGRIPYPDAYFDVVFADNVMEHLSAPVDALREVHRVLKPSGIFLFKTPNKTHYMPTFARLSPHWFHQFVNRLRGRADADTFPTFYRANSLRTVRALCERSGFVPESIERIEGRPEYLRMSWPTYLVGAAYERLVNSTDMLAMLRIVLIAELRKSSHVNAER